MMLPLFYALLWTVGRRRNGVFVAGHGYLKTPRSRNYVAKQDGKWSGGTFEDPLPESCPHCLNIGGTLSACGITGSNDYSYPQNVFKEPLPPKIQATYNKGEIIDVDVVLTAHHKGHFVFKACPISPGQAPTQDCFDKHPLEFVEDMIYDAPRDENYSERAYIPEGAYSKSISNYLFSYRLKLPDNLVGDLVLLQWYYLTANSCIPEGYDEYTFPEHFPDYKSQSLNRCGSIPPDGKGVPEQFWNCAEIRILGDADATVPPPDTTSLPPDSTTMMTNEPPISSTTSSTTASTQDPGAGGEVGNFCGTSWTDANAKCLTSCSDGNSTVCALGEHCYADVPCNVVETTTTTTTTTTTDMPTTEVPPVTTTPPVSTTLHPSTDCSSADKHMSVNFGYYQSWAMWRPTSCHPVHPENIDVSSHGYTHLSYAFASIDENWKIEPWAGDVTEHERYEKFNSLKQRYPDLKTSIAVGGWSFNDPGPTQTRFSDVSSTQERRDIFAKSVADFLVEHGFDGIDLDWEYPAASDRGGKPEDRANYVQLVAALRAEFASRQLLDKEITMAIPVSTSKLEEGYDLPALSENLDFFNLMAYDIHGSWDNPAVVDAHTDLQYIENTVWYLKQHVPSDKLVLGLGAYGRTYTLSDPTCIDAGCPFSSGGSGGCAGQTGYMPYFTIDEYIQTGNYDNLHLNSFTGSMELVVDGNQWISYDGPETIPIKLAFADDECMRGQMWWAVDLLKEPISSMPTSTSPPTWSSSSSTSTTAQPTTTNPTKTQSPTSASSTANPETSTTDGPVSSSSSTTIPDTSTTTDGPEFSSSSTTVPDTSTTTDGPIFPSSSTNSPETSTTTDGPVTTILTSSGTSAPVTSTTTDGPVSTTFSSSTTASPETSTTEVPNPVTTTAIPVISTTNRCGSSEIDARENCGKTCSSWKDCPGQNCWGVHPNYCGSNIKPVWKDPEVSTSGWRCGKNEVDAREFCKEPCSSATDCATSGESCFAVFQNYCDSDVEQG